MLSKVHSDPFSAAKILKATTEYRKKNIIYYRNQVNKHVKSGFPLNFKVAVNIQHEVHELFDHFSKM